jgi:hypothetical protein
MLRAANESLPTPPRERPRRLVPWSILVTAAVIAGVSGLYVCGQLASRRAAEEHKLLAIADLKGREVERWNEDLERHAASVARRERVVSAVEELRRAGGAEAAAQASAMLDELIAPERYEAARLLSVDGAVLASSGDAREELSAIAREVALDAITARRLVVGQLVPDGADLRVVTAVPLNDAAGELAAAVVLDAPAAATVLRDVRRWPGRSATGEIRLARRSALDPGALSAVAEGARSPLALARLGASGVVRAEEADGRGVIAAIRPIGATEWALVASVGTAEVDQPIWSLAGPVATIAILLLAAHAAFIAAHSRAQRAATAGRLAARMAHQLNSPLASVLANARFALAELRGERADVDEAKEALSDAVEATQRAAAVVRSLEASARQGRELAAFDDEAANSADGVREKVA